MILVLGHSDDSLIREVRSQLTGDRRPMLCLSEHELFSNISFAFEQSGTRSGGYLRIDGMRIRLNELSSVLVRLPRFWWPPDELDLQDQMFVYHETSAAWFALIASLGCPVVNRVDLAWWLSDITYPDALVHDLGRKLDVHTRAAPLAEMLPARILPKMPNPSCSSVYVAGRAVIPREAMDRKTGDWLGQHLPALASWQRESGVELCRLDFDREGDDFCLQHVEIFPLLDEEPTDLVDQIAGATVEMLA
jgi:hypothetical protein